MTQANIVFIIDISGIQRDPPVVEPKDEPGGSSMLKESYNESTDMFPMSDVGEAETARRNVIPPEYQLEWLKDFVLMTLHKEAAIMSSNDYDYGRVQWCFKFFDSTHHTDFKDGRAFMPFDYESFTNFEKHVQQRFKAKSDKSTISMSQYDHPPAKYLTDTIKMITGTLTWPEDQSQLLNLSRSFTADEPTPTVRNLVYAFFRVPRTERELNEFADLKLSASSKDFMKVILPDPFSNKFHFKLKIQLNFVDMWTAPENKIISYLPAWKGEYPRQIVKCLHYLSSGKIMLIPAAEYNSFRSFAVCFGIIPYAQYLRTRLQQVSLQNENVPARIQRLAERTSGGGQQKTSPNFDVASSLGRSLRSGPSLIDAPMNLHSKILRPFGNQSGYESDRVDVTAHFGHHRPSMTDSSAHDHARERKRKRLDLDYDPDEYVKPNHSRRSFYDNLRMEMESNDTDSVCEREQRLEKWVSDGVFTESKSKRYSDVTSSANPMSRPAQHKSSHHHKFQEPAPKPHGSRAKEMLATVKRQKLKETSVHQQKRRSSEGIDKGRLLQKHEEELGAFKHRLRAHLSGELVGISDALHWLKKFKYYLHQFASIVLQEESPSLVPLAQALVNYASCQFNEPLLQRIRGRLEGDISVKSLLKEVLLIDFSSLNKKIIAAEESPKDGRLLKKLAFREAELQIILRVEIAWCYVAPSEDATEELLAEIVRLLQIIGAYRTQAPVENFMNTVLLPSYMTGTRFMRELYKRMNFPIPFDLTIAGSPVPATSRRDDDSSIISSTSSYLYPEDSASQLHMPNPKRPRNSHAGPKKNEIPHGRKSNSESKRAKRQIMVATSNPNLTHMQFAAERVEPQKKNASNKVSPKRVRRNLFAVQAKDKKDTKTLLALSSRMKSPAFKSPKSKTRSPSGFFRAARSRKQLVMNNEPVEPQFGSPNADADVLCPPSPATPGDRMSMTSRLNSTPGACGKLGVIQESPVVSKNDYDDSRPITRVASLSFYSTGGDTSKSRAWEKSNHKLMEEKMKESVEVCKKMTYCDPDIGCQSPISGKYDQTFVKTCSETGSQEEENQSTLEVLVSPDKPFLSGNPLPLTIGPSPDLTNPAIIDLINSTSNFPNYPFLPKDTEANQEILLQPIVPSPTNLQTPSKRVQFNLNENLVNTPASRKSTCGTPKSILKETQETPPPAE